MAAPKKINLLPTDEFEKTPLGQFLKWALTIGRYIVITTELIVILAFLSRFKFDRDLVNLNEKINAKLAIIDSFGDLETRTRVLQFQLGNIKTLAGEKLEVKEALDFVSQNTPLNMVFTSLSLDKNSLNFEGVAFSDVDLATFLNKLEESELFEGVNIESIFHGGEEATEIEFSLKANFKSQEELKNEESEL